MNSSSTVTVTLSTYDLHAVKSIGYLCTHPGDTYLGLSTGSSSGATLARTDDSGSVGSPLGVVPIGRGEPLQVRGGGGGGGGGGAGGFVPDSTPPRLVAFDVDHDLGVLRLVFDEPVNVKSLNVSGIVLQGAEQRGGSAPSRRLTEGGSAGEASPASVLHGKEIEGNQRVGAEVIDVKLDGSDLGYVNSRGLGGYLVLDSFAFSDMAFVPNAVEEIPDGAALPVRSVVPDGTGPVVTGWGLDLSLGTLSLNFSEPVDQGTLRVSGLAVQGSRRRGDTGGYNLTEDTIVVGVERGGARLVLDLAMFRTDLNALKVSMGVGVASDLASSFLTVEDGAVEDFSGNGCEGIGDGTALKAEGYRGDGEDPNLLSFDLETGDEEAEDYGVLTLHFDEPVDPQSVSVGGLTLGDSGLGAAEVDTLNLARSTVSATTPSFDVEVTLGAEDLAHVRGSATMQQGRGTTFLTVGQGAARDVSGNELGGVDRLMLGPVLLRVTFSMVTGEESVALVFSELVDTGSFDASGVTLHGGAGGGGGRRRRRRRGGCTGRRRGVHAQGLGA